jgi:hypothetical protein
MKVPIQVMVFCVLLMAGLISCKKNDNNPTPPVTKTDSIQVAFDPAGPNTFFSFKNDAVVSNADSATTKWDFGVRNVNFIINSHASGPGNAGVITQPGVYDSYTQAAQSGYAYDTTSSQLAIDAGFTTGWYIYNLTTHSFSPKAGQFFVIRTADNHYAKMEILSVDYLPFTGQVPVTLIYKFRYTYQSDGSTNF